MTYRCDCGAMLSFDVEGVEPGTVIEFRCPRCPRTYKAAVPRGGGQLGRAEGIDRLVSRIRNFGVPPTGA